MMSSENTKPELQESDEERAARVAHEDAVARLQFRLARSRRIFSK